MKANIFQTDAEFFACLELLEWITFLDQGFNVKQFDFANTLLVECHEYLIKNTHPGKHQDDLEDRIRSVRLEIVAGYHQSKRITKKIRP